MRLIKTLVVLAVLALGLDRGGDYVAENIVASRLQDDQNLQTKPSVSIDGFPFLNQFATGRYERVRATATSVPIRRTGLTLASMSLDFRDVTTNRDFTRIEAASATAGAVIGYDDLGRLFDLRASYAGNGRVSVSKSFTVSGRTVQAAGTLEPTYSRGSLRLGRIALGDAVPSAVADRIRSAVDGTLPLTGLPFDVTVQSLRATPAGLELVLRGTNLTYTD